MHVHALRCFGARPGDGNPALVIEGDGMPPAERQRFAQEHDTTCVFLDQTGEITRVDYFYPHTRSPLCLHATLAVAQVLFARAPGAENIAVETAMQGQRLVLSREGGDYFVRLAPQPAPAVGIGGEQLASLLRAPALAPASTPRTASVGSPKLLVEVRDTDTLYGLAPDLAGIVEWGKAQGVNGLYVYCRLADGSIEGRNFNHLDPSAEDSATGVAAGALTVLLGRGLLVRQGSVTGRDCLIRTRLEDGAVFVGGAAETMHP